VRRFGVLWWESILAFSKRDQLSFDFARIEAECPLEYWPGATHDNPLLDWNGSLSPQRVRASFDNKRYAWLHRSEPDAQQDPRAHFLRQGGGMGSSYDRATDLLEYVCHMVGSSLGDQVSPRRGAARALESLLAPHRSAGQRYLLARVQGGTGAQAFDATELEHAGQALAMLLNPAQGTLIDLQAAELQADGKVYSTAQVAYDLIVLIGADGPQLGAAVQKLHRLLRRDQGSFVAVLTSPVALSQAAEAERTLAMAAGDTTLRVDSSLHASRHDNQHAPLPNTVVGYAWQTVTATVPQPLNHQPEHTA
jgi:hypothetical protein